MIKKFAEVLKYLGVVTGILIGVISCENDFKNVGVSIVDNSIFSTKDTILEVIAFSRNIDSNQTNALDHYLLGVQSDLIFGKLETSIIGQLSLPMTDYEYGLNAVIDTVIVDIPYLATLDGTQTYVDEEDVEHEVPKFVLDSIWPKGDKSFQLNVFELGTYLSNIDDNDPTKPKKYYNVEVFDKLNSLYSNSFVPNPNDTMLIVDRYRYLELGEKEIYKKDTIKKTELSPSIKIPLDVGIIKTIFQDNAEGSEFASNANFYHYFRGLYLEALEISSANASLMTLDLSQAAMTIYFSYDVMDTEEEDEDLDEDGIFGEDEPVKVRTPNSFKFPFSGIKTNLYNRDDSGSVENYLDNNANQTDGENLLFVQGAAGTDVVIKLFGEDSNENEIPDDLEMLRNKNWLINDAQLILNIDQNNTTNWTPERLYLYVYGGEEGENTQTLDAMRYPIESTGGKLQRDSDGNPEKYTFYITEFISEILKHDSELTKYNFGVKVYHKHDIPTFENDTILRKFNTNPKGLVLKGNLPSSDETRIKLEIYYSEKN